MRLRDKVACVTGGGSGIGLAGAIGTAPLEVADDADVERVAQDLKGSRRRADGL